MVGEVYVEAKIELSRNIRFISPILFKQQKWNFEFLGLTSQGFFLFLYFLVGEFGVKKK